MTTPPSRLIEKLRGFDLIDVRSEAGLLEERVTPMQAIAYAIRGTVEGVGPSSGAIRYLRKLPPSAMCPAESVDNADSLDTGRSTAFTQTRLGVYLQEVESSRMDDYGMPTRVIIGHVYAHCGLRGM